MPGSPPRSSKNLTVAQAAARVGCSAATVQRAVLRGYLPGVRIGRDVWLEPAAVNRWAQSRDQRS